MKNQSLELLVMAPGMNIGVLDPARLSEEQLLRVSYLLGKVVAQRQSRFEEPFLVTF